MLGSRIQIHPSNKDRQTDGPVAAKLVPINYSAILSALSSDFVQFGNTLVWLQQRQLEANTGKIGKASQAYDSIDF